MSKKYEMTGRIIAIDDTMTFESGFQKREFIVEEEDGKYPQQIKMEVVKDNCTLLDDLSVDQEITSHFNIRGNEFKGRYYVNLVCWRIESEEKAQQPESKPRQEPTQPQQAPATDYDDEKIPF